MLLAWGDNAFANVEDEKSQHGEVVVLTCDADAVVAGDFRKVLPLQRFSVTIRRVARATLAAEAYATSEVLEPCQWIRQVLTEIPHGGTDMPLTLKRLEAFSPSSFKVRVMSDANNLTVSAQKDSGKLQDKRLIIVIAMLRRGFHASEDALFQWEPTYKMVVDALTKLMDGPVIRDPRRLRHRAARLRGAGKPSPWPGRAGSTRAHAGAAAHRGPLPRRRRCQRYRGTMLWPGHRKHRPARHRRLRGHDGALAWRRVLPATPVHGAGRAPGLRPAEPRAGQGRARRGSLQRRGAHHAAPGDHRT